MDADLPYPVQETGEGISRPDVYFHVNGQAAQDNFSYDVRPMRSCVPRPSSHPLWVSEELGIAGPVPPRGRPMATVTARQDSFRHWSPNESHNVRLLAEAGFYYTGIQNQVQCFYCGISISGWSNRQNCDAWVVHAMCSPRCPYIHLCRGRGFVDRVQRFQRRNRQQQQNAADDRFMA